MKHLFRYRFKCMIRNKILIFWTFLFPLVLTTLFGTVLAHAYDTEGFQTISIAVLDTPYYQKDQALQELLSSVKSGDQKMFDVQVVSEDQAKSLLKDGKISAYVEDSDQLHVFVYSNGLHQTITQTFFDEYLQQKEMVMNFMKKGVSPEQLGELFANTNNYVKENASDNSNMSSVFFFTVLGMNALFGGYWAIDSMYELQANQSSRAMRVGVSPTHKAVNLFVDFILNIMFQSMFQLVLLLYMMFALHIDFGEHIAQVFVILTCGLFAGNGLGMLIGNIFPKFNVETKTGILTSITLAASFLSGMMIMDVKYLVQTYAPVLAAINPVNMITDGLYALYYYGVGERFYQNVVALLLFTLLCYILSYFFLRKRSFDSLEAK